MSNKMILNAVKKINGEEIYTYTEAQDTTIRNFVAKESEGNAQVSDTYFKHILKVVDSKSYIYQIHHIEVFPFNQQTPKYYLNPKENQTSEGVDDFKIEVYLVDGDSVNVLSGNMSGQNISLEELQLPPEALKYVESQSAAVRESRERIEKEIKDFKAEYQKNDKRFENDLRKIKSGLVQYRKTVTDLEKENSDKKRILKDSGSKIADLNGKYINYKKQYNAFYKNKISFVNKIEQKSTLGSYEPDLTEMAGNTLEIIKELKKSNVKNVVMFEQSESGQSFKSLTAKPVEYYPNMDSFKILYLTFDYGQGSNTLLLNIAYKVRWSSEMDLIINKEKKILVDNVNKKEWKVFNSNVVSPRFPGALETGNGWRLPTFQELSELSDVAGTYKEEKGKNPFDELGWLADYPYLSDPANEQDMYQDENNDMRYKCYNFKQYKSEDMFEEEGVYCILVRPIQEKAEQ